VGLSLFTFPPKEGVLRIFIALKKSSQSAGLSPRTSGQSRHLLNEFLLCKKLFS
jgi:hypothetical protein